MTGHLVHPYRTIESGKDFTERMAVQFGLDYLDAIKAEKDPKQALEFAKAAAGFADGAESERAKEIVDACFKAAYAKSARFPLIPFDDIKPDDGLRYLIKGLLQSTGLVVVWGPPKCGKSWTFDALMHGALEPVISRSARQFRASRLLRAGRRSGLQEPHRGVPEGETQWG